MSFRLNRNFGPEFANSYGVTKAHRQRDSMYIQINAHNSLTAPARLQSWASKELERALSRFSAKISRIEVYLSDENQAKEGGNDKRCPTEEGFPMTAVAHQGDTFGEAPLGATEKLTDCL